MSDQELEALLASVKRYSMRVLRPTVLALTAYLLSAAQGYFGYPNLLIAFVVFVLASSNYGARAAYALVLFLMLLILLPPEVMVSFQKLLASHLR